MYKALLNCEPEMRSESDVRLIVSMLKNVKFLKTVPPELQVEVCRVIRLRPYRARGLKIIKQGDVGSEFYIVSDGEVRVTQTQGQKEVDVATLNSGNYFGEMALIDTDRRQANVIASTDVEVFTLTRDQFVSLLGPLSEIIKRESERRATDLEGENAAAAAAARMEKIELKDLSIKATLGTGTFGRVKLVQHKKTKNTYALKILRKAHIVAYKQQANVMSEKKVMMEAQHPFILRLVSTMKDRECLYMLIEVCMGGELFNYLHLYPARGPNEYIPNKHSHKYGHD